MYLNLSDKIIKWLNKETIIYQNTIRHTIINETFDHLVALLKKKNFHIININKFKEEYIKYLYKYSYVE